MHGRDGRGRVVAIIKARTGSTRLPRKVMLDLWGKPVLERVCDGVRRSRAIDETVVATSTLAEATRCGTWNAPHRTPANRHSTSHTLCTHPAYDGRLPTPTRSQA